MGNLFLFYHNVDVLTNSQVSLSFGGAVKLIKITCFASDEEYHFLVPPMLISCLGQTASNENLELVTVVFRQVCFPLGSGLPSLHSDTNSAICLLN